LDRYTFKAYPYTTLFFFHFYRCLYLSIEPIFYANRFKHFWGFSFCSEKSIPSPSGYDEKVMFVKDSICLVKRTPWGSKIVLHSKGSKSNNKIIIWEKSLFNGLLRFYRIWSFGCYRWKVIRSVHWPIGRAVQSGHESRLRSRMTVAKFEKSPWPWPNPHEVQVFMLTLRFREKTSVYCSSFLRSRLTDQT
jgi:hypothetical protein